MKKKEKKKRCFCFFALIQQLDESPQAQASKRLSLDSEWALKEVALKTFNRNQPVLGRLAQV